MSEKMFPDQNEIIVCGSCGKDVIAKRWNTHACDVGPDATNPPKEVAGEGPYHLGAWYNAEEGTEEETIEGPGFPKGIDSFELTNEILNIAYAQGLAAKEAEFEKINVRLMKAEAELAKATDRWEKLQEFLREEALNLVADFVDDKAKFKG